LWSGYIQYIEEIYFVLVAEEAAWCSIVEEGDARKLTSSVERQKGVMISDIVGFVYRPFCLLTNNLYLYVCCCLIIALALHPLVQCCSPVLYNDTLNSLMPSNFHCGAGGGRVLSIVLANYHCRCEIVIFMVKL
jgi:hypothetical protein